MSVTETKVGPIPENVADPCLRCKGAGRIIVVTGEREAPVICCWCGGSGEK
jgi:DnaJ-class molecular chaperone